MSANTRLRILAVAYLLIALLSTLTLISILPESGTDHGLRKYQIVIILSTISIVTGGLGAGLWNLSDVARVLTLVWHSLLAVIHLAILLVTGDFIFQLGFAALNIGIVLLVYFSEPDPPVYESFELTPAQLKQLLTSPNTRLRTIALLYYLGAIASVILMVIGLLSSGAHRGIPPIYALFMFGGLAIFTAGLGFILWNLYDISRWIAMVVHSGIALTNIAALLQNNQDGNTLNLLLLNLVIIATLYFSPPEYEY